MVDKFVIVWFHILEQESPYRKVREELHSCAHWTWSKKCFEWKQKTKKKPKKPQKPTKQHQQQQKKPHKKPHKFLLSCVHVPEEVNARWTSYKVGHVAVVILETCSWGMDGWKSVLGNLDWWNMGSWVHEIATKLLLVKLYSVQGKIYWENHSTVFPNVLSYPLPCENPDTHDCI